MRNVDDPIAQFGKLESIAPNPSVFAEVHMSSKLTEMSCHIRKIIQKTLAATLNLLPSSIYFYLATKYQTG